MEKRLVALFIFCSAGQVWGMFGEKDFSISDSEPEQVSPPSRYESLLPLSLPMQIPPSLILSPSRLPRYDEVFPERKNTVAHFPGAAQGIDIRDGAHVDAPAGVAAARAIDHAGNPRERGVVHEHEVSLLAGDSTRASGASGHCVGTARLAKEERGAARAEQ